MKTLAISIVLTFAAGSVMAGTDDDHFQTDALLPAHVLAGIEDLAAHGDRFELAIEMIRKEAVKPTWGWDTCGSALPMLGS